MRRLIIIAVVVFILLLILAMLFVPSYGPLAAAAPSLTVLGSGSSAIVRWEQPTDSDTAIVLRRRNPQLVEALRLIAGPQTVVDCCSEAGDQYWVTFWSSDGSYRSSTGIVIVHWEQRFPFVSE